MARDKKTRSDVSGDQPTTLPGSEILADFPTLASDPEKREQLLAQLLTYIRQEHELVLHHAGQTVLHAIRCGRALLAAEPLVPPGQREAWIESLTGMSCRTGQRYMQLVRNLPNVIKALREELSLQAKDVSLTDEELLASTSQTHCLRLISSSNRKPTEKRRKKKRLKNTEPTLATANLVEWLTPASLLQAALAFLQEIDLDPAAAAEVSMHVPAKRAFAANEDGLKQAWEGRIWLSPGQNQLERWVAKSEETIAARDAEILLVAPVETDAPWFVRLRSAPRVLLSHRPAVINPADPRSAAMPLAYGLAVFLLARSPRLNDFAAAFAPLGDTFVPIRAE